jgi:hypothetical protein
MSTTEPRIFTIEEVNALIPTLSSLVARQLVQQSEIERGLGELARLTGEVPRSLDASGSDSGETARVKDDLRARITRYEQGWRDVQGLGAVIKDPQIGLVDFYGRVEGRLVWLCWRYGEESLGYYHDLDTGYSGRRPLRADARERLLN